MKKDGRRKVNATTVARMKQLRKQGLSYAKIGNKLGISMLTVYNYLKKEGIGSTGKVVKDAKPAKKNQKIKSSVPKKKKKESFLAKLKRSLGMS